MSPATGPGTTSPAVLVTRPARGKDPFIVALAACGYRAIAVPTVATALVGAGEPLDGALVRLGAFDWVVLTSAAGVDAVAAASSRLGVPTPLPSRPPRWAAVGPATARAIAQLGVDVDAVAPGPGAASLPGALAAHAPLPGARVLLPRANAADDELPSLLRAAGAVPEDVFAYHTIEAPPASLDPLADALDDPALAAIVVASASAVRGLVTLASACGRRDRLDRVPLVSIGPSTSAAVRSLGLAVAAEAARPSPAGIADAVAAGAHIAASTAPRPLEARR